MTGNRLLDDSLHDVTDHPGKLLRPLLHLASAHYAKKKVDLEVAASIEMLHLASLIHDDIIDEAKLRRNLPTIQSKYGKDYAVYMGDYLLSSVLVLLASTDLEKEHLGEIAKVMNRMCVSEMKQYHARYHYDLRKRDYLDIISGKTAALFSLAMGSAVTDELKPLFLKAGYLLGIAFQLQDDLLDFKGDELVVGKDLKRDLLMGYYHLPIIHSLSLDDRMKKALEGEIDLKEIEHILIENKSIEYTEKLTEAYFTKCIKLLETLPETEERKDLIDLILTITKRNN
ncbi:polyprenyl synthetase family protein [Guggenheimella bovis]